MSEFPEWIEDGIGWTNLTYEESLKIHQALTVLRRWVPDLDERMSRPSAQGRWFKWLSSNRLTDRPTERPTEIHRHDP